MHFAREKLPLSAWIVVHLARILSGSIGSAGPTPAARGNAEDGNPRVLMALFASMANIQLIHVPYKGGGPMAASLMSGETQSAVATVGSSLPPLALGRVRAVGVTSARRLYRVFNSVDLRRFTPTRE